MGARCDRVLDAALVAFAVWTVAYHVSVLTRAPAWAAAALWAAGCAVAAVGGPWRAAGAVSSAASLRAPRRPVLVAGAVAAVGAAVLFAFTGAPFVLVWVLWLVAAGAGIVAGARASSARSGRVWLERWVVAAWAVGLAGLSLGLNGPDADDAYYVHLSAWIGVHGTFPVRDVLFGDQRFAAIYFPPVSAYEALAGTVAHLTPLAAPAVVYYVVPPVSAVLSVLALWRLLRAWEVRPAAVGLSVALTFLIVDAAAPRLFGGFFVGRIWQGKVLFVSVGIPLLLAVLQERRSLVLVAAAGITGVGLTTTAMFMVPVIAAGWLIAGGRRALPAAVAVSGYPVVAGVVTLGLHGRTPDHYTNADVVPSALAHYVLGTGGLALLGVTAALAGPLVLPRRPAGAFAASLALVVGLLLAPGVPALVLHVTGLGRVLWRLLWALPVAALLGALAVQRRLVVPIVVVLVLAAHPIWRLAGGPRRAHAIAYKQPPGQLRAARLILRHTVTGDVVLAPETLAQTIAAISGRVYTVDTRDFYTNALPPDQAAPRRLLAGFAAHGLFRTGAGSVLAALRAVRVDLACVPAGDAGAQRLLRADRYVLAVHTGGVACLRRRGPLTAT